MTLVEKASYKQSKQPKIWKPAVGEVYFLIASDGLVFSSRWNNRIPDNQSWEFGNVYKTKVEAEFYATKQKLMTKLKRISLEKYILGADDEQGAYTIAYGERTHEVICYAAPRNYLCPIKFNTYEDAKLALKEIGGVDNYIKYIVNDYKEE